MKLLRDLEAPNGERIRAATVSEAEELYVRQMIVKHGEYLQAKYAAARDPEGPVTAETQAELLGELLETVQSFIRREGHSIGDIRRVASRRRKESGGFDKAMVVLDDWDSE